MSAHRSAHAQLQAMRKSWPDFTGIKLASGDIVWRGPLTPKVRTYEIGVVWKPGDTEPPHVRIIAPQLEPREGGSYEEIPHLLFDAAEPQNSGLCLYDPDGHEWTGASLIAETTIWWAAEWLAYYELWHMTGKWLAPSVGYESVAHIRAAQAANAARES